MVSFYHLVFQSQNQLTTPQSMAGHDVSQIDGPTPKNRFGFRVNSQCIQDAKAMHEVTLICRILELRHFHFTSTNT